MFGFAMSYFFGVMLPVAGHHPDFLISGLSFPTAIDPEHLQTVHFQNDLGMVSGCKTIYSSLQSYTISSNSSYSLFCAVWSYS